MNLLLYFCVPLVVTGQTIVRNSLRKVNSEESAQHDVKGLDTSETETYSKYEYGSHVGYKNSPLDEFAVDQSGEYYRRPSIEDTGEIGKPSIYNTNVRNNDHPSFIASNIYNSIRDKKNNNNIRGNKNVQMPSPLAYGAPAIPEEDAALVISADDQRLQSLTNHHHTRVSPLVHKTPLVPLTSHQHVLLRDPHSGQLVQGPAYQNGLLPLYHSHLAPQVGYDGNVLSQQKLVPTVKTAGVSLYHQQLVGNAISPPPPEVLVKTAGNPLYQAPLLKAPGILPVYHSHLYKGTGEPVHETPLLRTDSSSYYLPQLINAGAPQLYQTAGPLVYHQQPQPLLKTTLHAHQPQLLDAGHGHAPLYHHPSMLAPVAGPPYQQHLLKTGNVPLLLKQPIHPHPLLLMYPIYPTPVAAHQSIAHHPGHQTPLVLKDNSLSLHHHHQPVLAGPTVVPLVQQHILKATPGPLLETPLLKAPGVEAHIVPAIEEHVHGIHHHHHHHEAAHVKHPGFIQYVTPGLLAPKQPKIVLQKAILHKPPVFAGKAVLKAALSPVYKNPAIDVEKAIFKAPMLAHFVHHGHLEHDLPAKILSSQKALVNTLISSDSKRFRSGKGAELYAQPTNIELVPSLSYGYSYSLYPKGDGFYGPPEDSHHHHK